MPLMHVHCFRPAEGFVILRSTVYMLYCLCFRLVRMMPCSAVKPRTMDLVYPFWEDFTCCTFSWRRKAELLTTLSSNTSQAASSPTTDVTQVRLSAIYGDCLFNKSYHNYYFYAVRNAWPKVYSFITPLLCHYFCCYSLLLTIPLYSGNKWILKCCWQYIILMSLGGMLASYHHKWIKYRTP